MKPKFVTDAVARKIESFGGYPAGEGSALFIGSSSFLDAVDNDPGVLGPKLKNFIDLISAAPPAVEELVRKIVDEEAAEHEKARAAAGASSIAGNNRDTEERLTAIEVDEAGNVTNTGNTVACATGGAAAVDDGAGTGA